MTRSMLAVAAMAACGTDEPPTVLQPLDFAPGESKDTFERNKVIDADAFSDGTSVELAAVEQFLSRTPYGRPSFLATYQSNGVRAADAIVAAARKHRINPIVFLVYAQTTQGLLGERNYPFPPDRVEYVFRCGCLQPRECLPTFAGFDRQVDCLGRALRGSIDEIQASDVTASGWGPDVAMLTLDNVKVTPENEATAALYARTPRVAEGRAGGTWIFWNVFRLYASKLGYFPAGGTASGRWIGEACQTAAMCSGFEGGVCADQYPGGLCTVSCTGDCPSEPSRPEAFCAKFNDGGFCLPVCNPAAPACRSGYTCQRVKGVGTSESKHVCSPSAG